MNMKRREFSAVVIGAGVAAVSMATPAQAQGGPVEGTHYVRLSQPVPATVPGKIEVIEFFWYGCSHCFAFEPTIEAWSKRVAPDVYFHPTPFAFIGPVEHQKMFYALEELGQRESLHRKLFNAIHVENKRLNSEAEITAFVATHGVDGAKFTEAFRSFAVNTKVSRGKQLSNAYKIDSVPSIGVNGRYYTSASLAGSPEKAIAVTDFLIQRARLGT